MSAIHILTTTQAREVIGSMDEIGRIRLWWHWMIENGLDSITHPPKFRHADAHTVGLDEFFADSTLHVNAPNWSLAHTVVERYAFTQDIRDAYLANLNDQ